MSDEIEREQAPMSPTETTKKPQTAVECGLCTFVHMAMKIVTLLRLTD